MITIKIFQWYKTQQCFFIVIIGIIWQEASYQRQQQLQFNIQKTPQFVVLGFSPNYNHHGLQHHQLKPYASSSYYNKYGIMRRNVRTEWVSKKITQYHPLQLSSTRSYQVSESEQQKRQNITHIESDKNDYRMRQEGGRRQKQRNTATTRQDIIRNKKICHLGNRRQWDEIFKLYDSEGKYYNSVNYATMLSQLVKIIITSSLLPSSSEEAQQQLSSTNNIDEVVTCRFCQDSRFVAFLDDLIHQLQIKGLQAWMGHRGTINIIQNLSKVINRCSSSSASNSNIEPLADKFMTLLSTKECAKWLVKAGNTNSIAIIVNAYNQIILNNEQSASAKAAAKNMLNEIEEDARRITDQGTPREIMDIAKSFDRFGFDYVPDLFVHRLKKFEDIERNKRIADLGKNGNFIDMLLLYDTEKNDFNNVNYATIMNQLGKIQEHSRSIDHDYLLFCNLLKGLACEIENNGLQWLGVRGVSNVIHAIAKLKLRQSNNSNNDSNYIIEQALLKENVEWLLHNKETKPQEVANIAWSVTKLYDGISHNNNMQLPSPDILFMEIQSRSDWLLDEGSPQDIANIGWAMSKLGNSNVLSHSAQPTKFFDGINEKSGWIVDNGSTQSISNIALSYAKINYQNGTEFFNQIEKHSKRIIQEGNVHSISNIARSCAELNVPLSTFFTEIERNADWLIDKASPQGISNIARAFSKLRNNGNNTGKKHHGSFIGQDIPLPVNYFAAIERKAEWLLRDGTTQTVSIISLSAAKLGIYLETLFSLINKNAKWLVRNGNPQEVANTALSFAKLNITSCTSLFREIENNSEWFVNSGNVQNIANVIWSCAKVNIRLPMLFDCIEKRCKVIIREGKPQEISSIAWSFAKLNVKTKSSQEFFEEINANAQRIVNANDTTSQTIANIAWSYATLGMEGSSGSSSSDNQLFFSEADKRSEWFVNCCNHQEISNLLWSFAKLDIYPISLFKELDKRVDWLIQLHDGNNNNIQVITKIAWAYAKLGNNNAQATNLFEQLDNCAEQLMKEERDDQQKEGIITIAWSAATLGIPIPKLLTIIDLNLHWFIHKEVDDCVTSNNNNNDSPINIIENIAWIYTKYEMKSLRLLEVIEDYSNEFVLLEEDRDIRALHSTLRSMRNLGMEIPKALRERF